LNSIKNRFLIAICAFIATLSLNVDLNHLKSIDDFRIEGYSITQRLEGGGTLVGGAEIIADFFSGFSGNSVKWLCIFFALCLLFYHAQMVRERRTEKISFCAATFFSFFYIIGFSINNFDSLAPITDSLTSFLKYIIAFMGITLTFYALLKILFDKITKIDLNNAEEKKIRLLDNSRKSLLMRTFVIFLCWLPYLIVYLPGFINIDTFFQIAQVVGDTPLSNHHPIFTTAITGFFYRLGLLFGSAGIGLLLHSIFQMFIMAAAFSDVIAWMEEYNAGNRIRTITLLYFMLYPVHGFYSIVMWKDTLFSVVLMLLTLKTIQMVSQPNEFFKQKKNIIIYSLLCVFLFLTRNNGLYILVIFLPLLPVLLRKYWKSILIIIGVFAFSFFSMQIIESALKVRQGSVGEALSLPLQQIARAVKDHGETISDEDREIISAILPFEKLPELYISTNSDTIKVSGVFDENEFRQNSRSYLALWARLFTKYPLSYIDAFLCHTHGYWYPDFDGGIRAGRIEENDYNFYSWNIVPSFVENALSGIFVIRTIPAISMLVSIGFAVWLTIIMALVLLLKKSYRLLISFIPMLLLWLTCIASPVSGQFRYIYGLFLVIPLFITIALGGKNEKY